MKCVILAGGTGDQMWPLSRREYPKQFMQINKFRSIFQETVVRNMSLCDEFIITANAKHRLIAEGQMEFFQGLNYRFIFEEEGKGTALPVLLSAILSNPSELIYVVTCDHLIKGESYMQDVIELKKNAKNGKIALFGVKTEGYNDNYDYVELCEDNRAVFVEKESCECDAERNIVSNSGLMIFRAGDMVDLFEHFNPEYLYRVREALSKEKRTEKNIFVTEEMTRNIEKISIENSILKNNVNIYLYIPNFEWYDVSDFEVFEKYSHEDCDTNVIKVNSENTTVINQDSSKLVVVNKVNDISLVNTDNAIYVTNKANANEIKQIMHDNSDEYQEYFNREMTEYRKWGYRKTLIIDKGYVVKEAVIFPGKRIYRHKHIGRSEHWTIVEGVAAITIGAETKLYGKGESVYVPANIEHMLSNGTDSNIVIIEVSVGEYVEENDIISAEQAEDENNSIKDERIIKLKPAYKDYLWGGTKLRDIYGKECDYDIIAESWELSAHESGPSIVETGKFKGKTFIEYLNTMGKLVQGWKAEALDRFPILVKFIDAKEQLSVQIHPDDEFALNYENELGKNEMWYVMDCDEGASVYWGFKSEIDEKTLREKIEDNTILDVLNRVEVKKGDVIFVEAGTIHAIGKGIMICEIQQNSNCTYRLYDYNRKDKYGNKRELHLDKALKVLKYDVKSSKNMPEYQKHLCDGYTLQVLVSCKYFECIRYEVESELKLYIDEASFRSIIIIEGSGKIHDGEYCMDFKAGESFFIPALKKTIILSGRCILLVTHI